MEGSATASWWMGIPERAVLKLDHPMVTVSSFFPKPTWIVYWDLSRICPSYLPLHIFDVNELGSPLRVFTSNVAPLLQFFPQSQDAAWNADPRRQNWLIFGVRHPGGRSSSEGWKVGRRGHSFWSTGLDETWNPVDWCIYNSQNLRKNAAINSSNILSYNIYQLHQQCCMWCWLTPPFIGHSCWLQPYGILIVSHYKLIS